MTNWLALQLKGGLLRSYSVVSTQMGFSLSRPSDLKRIEAYMNNLGLPLYWEGRTLVITHQRSKIVITTSGQLPEPTGSYRILVIDLNTGPYRLRGQVIDIPLETRMHRLACLIRSYRLQELPYRLSKISLYRDEQDGELTVIQRR